MRTIYRFLLLWYEKKNNHEKKMIRFFLEVVRQFGIWLGDFSFSMEVRGKQMAMPVSHKLPIYIAEFPLYDTLPARISDYLRKRDNSLVMVDIGANIGDTILGCYVNSSPDRYLGVEANPEFIPYFKQNTKNLRGVLLSETLCHSGNKDHAYINIQSSGGTARLLEADEGTSITKKTLDDIILEHPDFENFNFLKIDTDGNDFDILRGATKSIGSSLPIIMLECDIFGNVNYVEDVTDSISSLAKLGYSIVVVYDNLGNLFSTFRVGDFSTILDALAFQIISEFGYYDLLFLCEKDLEFTKIEKEFFVQYCEKKGMSAILKKAMSL